MQKLIVFINGLVAVATLFAYLAGYVSPESTIIFGIFGIFYPILFGLNIFFILFWLIVKPKNITISILVLLLGINHIQRHIGTHNALEPDDDMQSIQLMSMNVNLGKFIHDRNQSKQKTIQDQFLKDIDISSLDILCLQEANKFPEIFFSKHLPEYSNNVKVGLIDLIYSKYPIIDSGQIQLNLKANSCAWADIQLPNKIIRVYSIHLHSNKISNHTSKILEQSGLEDQQAWSDIKFILKQYNIAAKHRVQELRKIQDHYKKSPYPVILAGDFNDTPESYIYNQITRDFKDAFVESAGGLGYSYAGAIPMLRIDFTFIDPSFTALNHRVVHKKYSDHYPIISTIGIAN